jgi:ABC-type phosphate transport system auxiliary subunit
MQVMNQQLQNMRADMEAALDGMRERQGELEEQLDNLTRLRNLVNSGNFDPKNAQHLALYNSAFDNDPEMSAPEFVLQTQSEQNDVIDGTESDVEAEQAELQIKTNELDQALQEVNAAIEEGTPLETDGIQFTNPVLERARLRSGEDANDLTSYDNVREGLRDELDDNLREQYNLAMEADNVEEQLGADSLFASLGNIDNMRR